VKNEFLIEFDERPNPEGVACQACERVDEVLCFTVKGKGPFCLECFESLCDPDQALLLEERLAKYEREIETGRVIPGVSTSQTKAGQEAPSKNGHKPAKGNRAVHA
jgi:hypothetical protein